MTEDSTADVHEQDCTPRMSRVLRASKKMVEDLGHSKLGVDHVFLSILTDRRAASTTLLARHVNIDVIIREVEDMLGSEAYAQPGS